jgi:hypothetical protein
MRPWLGAGHRNLCQAEKIVKIGAALGTLVVAGLSALVAAPAPALAAPAGARPAPTGAATGLLVSGHVTCADDQPVDGIWVASSGGGSTYARWRATSRPSASYTAWLATSIPTAISLHVGCGGSAVDWESANWTPAVLMVERSKTINAMNCIGGQCTFPSADRAAAWAERHLTAAGGGNHALTGDEVTDKRALGSWAGLGLAFALSAYLNGGGVLPRPEAAGPGATANSLYRLYLSHHLIQQAWVTSRGVSTDPPPGALVFYPSSASSGQVAISAGAGKAICANSSGRPLVRRQSYTSIPGYRGWAFPSNMVAGRPGPSAAFPAAGGEASGRPPHGGTSPAPRNGTGPAHARRGAIASRPGTSPAGGWDSWLWRALAGCLALLAMLAAVFAVRAGLRARTRYGRHRHEGAGPAGGAGGHGPDPPQPPATGACVAADTGETSPPRPRSGPAPDASLPSEPALPGPAPRAPRAPGPTPSELPTRGPSPCESPAPEPPPCKLPAAPPGTPPAVRGDTGGLAPAGGQARNDDPGPGNPAAGGGSRGPAEGPPVLSGAGLRLLGLRDAPSGESGGVAQRHEVTLGEYRVEVMLAEAPAISRKGRSPEGRGWVASAPYLVWTPLPHDVPGGGTAFVCVGAGKKGCLFIDLAAAPGPMTLRGESQGAGRLAESLVHQLCAGPAAHRVHLVVVADAVPAPAPPRAEWVASTAALGSRTGPGLGLDTELVFCRLRWDEEVFALARYAASAPYRVVPVILADLAGAPWSLAAHPIREPAAALEPVVS